jgi:hypothetical protein
LTCAFKRPTNILLKIGKQRGIGGIEPVAQNIARRVERDGFRAFEMFGDLVEGLFDPLVIGRLGTACVGVSLGCASKIFSRSSFAVP